VAAQAAKIDGRLSLKTILRVNWFARFQHEQFLAICADKSQGHLFWRNLFDPGRPEKFFSGFAQCRK
jgi:hypothetical protein